MSQRALVDLAYASTIDALVKVCGRTGRGVTFWFHGVKAFEIVPVLP